MQYADSIGLSGLLVLATLFFYLPGCGALNDCSFFEQCDGNTRLICGGGVDQQVGREINERPCPSETPICIEIDDRTTACTIAESSSCDDSYSDRCDGNISVTCEEGVISGNDCGWYKNDAEEPSSCLIENERSLCRWL